MYCMVSVFLKNHISHTDDFHGLSVILDALVLRQAFTSIVLSYPFLPSAAQDPTLSHPEGASRKTPGSC